MQGNKKMSIDTYLGARLRETKTHQHPKTSKAAAHSPDKFGSSQCAGRTEAKEASSGQNCKPGSVNFEGDSATDSVHQSARSHPSSPLTLPESSSWESSCFGAWFRFPAGTWSRQPPTHLHAVRHGPTGCGCRICLKADYHTGSTLAPPGAAIPLRTLPLMVRPFCLFSFLSDHWRHNSHIIVITTLSTLLQI